MTQIGPDRLTALETGLQHLREMLELHRRAMQDRLTELAAHNRVQDSLAERRDEQLSKEIAALRETLWSCLKWVGAGVLTTLASICLKALGLI